MRAVLTTLGVACLLGAAAVQPPRAAAATGHGPARVGVTGRFTIAGSASGLHPGDSATLTLVVANPQRYAIVVSSIIAKVGAANRSCGAGNLRAGSFRGRLALRGRSSARVSIRVTLRRSAPRACQGAVFPLRYTGHGRKA